MSTGARVPSLTTKFTRRGDTSLARRPSTWAGVAATLVVVALAALALGGSAQPVAATGSSLLRVGLTLEPSTLNIRVLPDAPAEQVLIDNVYQGLVGLNTVGEVVPVLARSVLRSPDGLRYDFVLHENVRFHSGEPLTVDDVVWSLEQQRTNPDLRGSALLQSVQSVKAINSQAVRLELSEPNSELLWTLAGRVGMIFEEGSLIDLNLNDNGTGPFRVASWKKGDSLALERFGEYWGQPAGVQRVEFVFIADENAAVNAAKAGRLEVLTNVDPMFIPSLQKTGNFAVEYGRSASVITLAYNLEHPPLNDLRVRRALSMAIDSNAVITVAQGTGVPLGGPIPMLDPGYQDLTAINAYNPAESRRLLAEAGVGALKLTMKTLNIYDTAIMNVLKTQLADVGVTLIVERLDLGTWVKEVLQLHDYELSLVNHVEAHDFEHYADPDYYFNYDNPVVQSLYEDAIRTGNELRTNDLLARAARRVAMDAPAKWVYNAVTPIVLAKDVKNFPTYNLNARLNLTQVTVGE